MDSKSLIGWYEGNYLKPNPDKWHLLLSETGKDLNIHIGNDCIPNSIYEKIFGVYFDNKLDFNIHVTKLCKKASQKLHALARVSKRMSCKQRLTIMNAFIMSQFSYCPLLWMCHKRLLHTQINNIHERALRIVYNDNTTSFDKNLDLLRNLQLIAIEIYKASNNMSTAFMSELFQIKDTKFNLRKVKILASYNIKTENNGKQSISYLAPIIWSQVPLDAKNCKSLNSFKYRIKQWIPDDCPCTLRKMSKVWALYHFFHVISFILPLYLDV